MASLEVQYATAASNTGTMTITLLAKEGASKLFVEGFDQYLTQTATIVQIVIIMDKYMPPLKLQTLQHLLCNQEAIKD